jgi:hypothetical protein
VSASVKRQLVCQPFVFALLAVEHYANTTVGTVSRLEAAKSAPAWATVMQMIDALGISLLELARAVEKARRDL